MDHRQCTVKLTPQWEEHTCPPCPHGLERGGSFALQGDARIDALQRELKMRDIDALTCEHWTHARALTGRR